MESSNDVEMKEEPSHEASLQSIQPTATPDLTDPQPSPQPLQPQTTHLQAAVADTLAATATASPALAAPAVTARPSSIPPSQSARPEKPVAHGGATRQYLNSNITPHLLEGMKYLAMYEPEKPLAWLADFLKDRSNHVEG